MTDFCELGSASLDPSTNTLLVRCKGAGIEADDDATAPDYGDAPLMCALGLAASPYPADSTGAAEGVVLTDVPGLDGVVVAARDVRASSAVAQLGPGETCVFATGPGFEARLFLKDQLAALVIGADTALVLDRKGEKATLTIAGHVLEVSRENGIVLREQGGAGLQLHNGMAIIDGALCLGRAPTAPLVAMVAGVPTIVPGAFAGV